jgi:hypothetical protein
MSKKSKGSSAPQFGGYRVVAAQKPTVAPVSVPQQASSVQPGKTIHIDKFNK